jgi:hypothetical protein
MRLVVIAAALGLAAPGAAHATPGCSGGVPAAPSGLPAPVAVTTACGVYTVSPSGAVIFGPRPAPQVQPSAGTYVDRRGRHIVAVSGGRIVWRSRHVFSRALYLAGGAVGAGDVAFSFAGGRLWVAPIGGAEHPVGWGENPLGWSAYADLLTTVFSSSGDGPLYVRAEDGSRRRTIAADTRGLRFDDATSTAWFFSAGALETSDGRALTAVARLRPLRLGAQPFFELLDGGLVAVSGQRRLVVLRRDGTSVAATALPKPTGFDATNLLTSGFSLDGDRVAFTVGNLDDGGDVATERVFVLRAGETQATQVFQAELDGTPCGPPSTVTWNGDWLLYSAPEGRAAAIDTADTSRSVDLSSFVSALPGIAPDEDGLVSFDADWAA